MNKDLEDNASVLEAVNQDANQLLEELRQIEGFDVESVEEELRQVNQKWNETKVQVRQETNVGCCSFK